MAQFMLVVMPDGMNMVIGQFLRQENLMIFFTTLALFLPSLNQYHGDGVTRIIIAELDF